MSTKQMLIIKLLSKVRPAVILILSAALLSAGIHPTNTAHAQIRAEYDIGATGLVQLLQRLQTTASALHTGAHPDDEDSGLISRLARGDHARVAYLSLNRGEGGQNILGNELFEPLGIVRTEELLQARKLDGGQQYFTRSYDYGFSKTLKEAQEKWDEKTLLADMVRTIRQFRPFVVISRFSGTPADGHGQHQMAGYLTPLAVKAAADPAQFPEQLGSGLHPWKVLKFYVEEGFRPNPQNQATLRVPTGVFDPVLGRTYYEIAAEGRSQQKTQEMGSLELHGPLSSGMRLAVNNTTSTGTENFMFQGIDTSIRGIGLVSGLPGGLIDADLARIQSSAEKVLNTYEPLAPARIVPVLIEGLKADRHAMEVLRSLKTDVAARDAAIFLLQQKETEFTKAIIKAEGMVFDALANRETVVPGEEFTLTTRLFVPEGADVKTFPATVSAPRNWTIANVTDEQALSAASRASREKPDAMRVFKITPDRSAELTQPYWMKQPRKDYLFEWNDMLEAGEPFAPSIATAVVPLEIGGEKIDLRTDVQYRYSDSVRGEIRRQINVVPRVSVGLDADRIVVPITDANRTRTLTVLLLQNSDVESRGRVHLEVPAGWKVLPADADFNLKSPGERSSISFAITIPTSASLGDNPIRAEAEINGEKFTQEMHVLTYPHIQTHRYYTKAETSIELLDVKTAAVNVGYIMGSGDDIPDAIRQMGLKVTMLGADDLATGDLSKFDVILAGVRAADARPDFIANHRRLLDYVSGGGMLIVQYQRPDYANKGLMPFPAQIGPRVADENAPVTVLVPDHPFFNSPNRITARDWEGWIQDRTVFNLTNFDKRYTPLLECHDPGEEPQPGGELITQLGKGNYVYTAYAWFRQLPGGVPGAYRLFANMLSFPRTSKTTVASSRPE